MTIYTYSILNMYAILLTLTGFILPAVIIYYNSAYKNYFALIISAIILSAIAYTVGNYTIVLLPFILPILLASLAGTYLRRSGEGFFAGMGYVIAAEFFGVMLGIIIVYISYGRVDIATLISRAFIDAYKNLSPNDEIYILQLNLMTQLLSISSDGTITQLAQIEGMSIAEKIDIIAPQIKASMAALLPSVIMGYGIISGVTAWFASSLLMARRIRMKKKLAGVKKFSPPPAFSSWKAPRWMTNILMVLLLTSILISFGAAGTMLNVASALQSAAIIVLSIQGLAVVNWWLKKKRVSAVLNIIMCTLSVIFLSLLLPWIGLVDIVFSIRLQGKRKDLIKLRMEEIKKQIDKQINKENNEDKTNQKNDEDKNNEDKNDDANESEDE